MQEIWKPVVGYEGIYEVSNFGRIKSVDRIITTTNNTTRIRRGVIRKPSNNQWGYLQVSLHREGIRTCFRIHRLVAIAFIPEQDGKHEINHIDGNKKNNKTNNLEWCTTSENILHAVRTGLLVIKKGENTSYSKIKETDVIAIKKMYANGAKYREIENAFNVKRSTIWNIVKNHSWKHISI